MRWKRLLQHSALSKYVQEPSSYIKVYIHLGSKIPNSSPSSAQRDLRLLRQSTLKPVTTAQRKGWPTLFVSLFSTGSLICDILKQSLFLPVVQLLNSQSRPSLPLSQSVGTKIGIPEKHEDCNCNRRSMSRQSRQCMCFFQVLHLSCLPFAHGLDNIPLLVHFLQLYPSCSGFIAEKEVLVPQKYHFLELSSIAPSQTLIVDLFFSSRLRVVYADSKTVQSQYVD